MFELPQANLDRQKHQETLAGLSTLESSMIGAFQELIKYLDGKVTKTEVLNQLSSISTPDVQYVVQAISKLDGNIAKKNLDLTPILLGLAALETQLKQIPKRLPDAPKPQDSVQVSNLSEINKQFASLETAIKGLKLTAEAPKVNVTVPEPKVTVEKTNLAPVQTALMQVLGAIERIHFPEVKPTEVAGVEKRLEGLGEWLDLVNKSQAETNKKLQKLIEKPIGGGGGGGGSGAIFKDSTGNLSYPTLDPQGHLPVISQPYAIQIDDVTTPNITYIGKAYPGASTASAVWQISKIDSTSGTNITWAAGSSNFNQVYDSRASLAYS